MSRRIKIAALLLTLIMILTAAGCAGKPAGPEKTDTAVIVPTQAPETEDKATGQPGTEAPGTDIPATEANKTELPATELPATDAVTPDVTPTTDSGVTDVPASELPATETTAPTDTSTVIPNGTPEPPKPTATPTKAPTVTPTKAPTATPTKTPTKTPTPAPTDPNKLSDADQARAEALLNSVKSSVPAFANTSVSAANDDQDITVWFNHSYINTPAEDVTPTQFKAYQINLAKNEIEGCHFIVASKAAKSGLDVSVSEFSDGKGHILDHDLCFGWYFDGVGGKTVADPIPVLERKIDLKANKSQMFIIKVKSKTDTPSGQYSAVITIKDGEDREIKKANVYAYVWNFALPVTSNCKTLSDLGEWPLIVGAGRAGTTQDGLEDDLYAQYYEYLLENKINCYTLPYAKRGQFWDDRVEQFLDDPRMNAFTLFWKIDRGTSMQSNNLWHEAYIEVAYNRVSKKQEWLDKAYFYPYFDEKLNGDEPLTKAALDNIIKWNAQFTKYFGKHKLIVPMHYNTLLSSGVDFFKYLENDVTVWCPKTYFFNTQADKAFTKKLYTEYYNASMEKTFGTFKDRMANEQAGGDEVWWYVTRFPHDPEITLSINDESVKHRLMFWQQKLYNVDGFLYYQVNEWQGDDPKVWNKKFEYSVLGTVVNTYGNGVLIYHGAGLPEFVEHYGNDGYPGGVGSLRLESVRDGVEDYDYFTILDELYGEGTSDLIIKQITTSLGVYSTDTNLFTTLRTAVGDLIAAKS